VILEFTAELWEWEARRMDSWVFVRLPPDASDEIRIRTEPYRKGFGAVKVRVRIGTTTWTTSIFPGGNDGPYVLPVKKAVRTAEALRIGDAPAVTVEILGSHH
jgi:hypothetical protein